MDVPSYMLDKKNWRKKFQIFFIFHRGDPYDFSKKISQKIFLKNHKGPPYEKWKKYEIFFFNFFCPKCSLKHPKMPVRSFFEKSLTNFECVLFVCPRILTTSPFLEALIFSPQMNWGMSTFPIKIQNTALICWYGNISVFRLFLNI